LNYINARNTDNTSASRSNNHPNQKLNTAATVSSSSSYPNNFNANHVEVNKAATSSSTSNNGNPTGLAAAATIKILSDTIKILSSNKTNNSNNSTPGDIF
jgi:hypothetical protein